MKSTRVLVLGLLLSGHIAEPAGQEMSGAGHDTREISQELSRRHSAPQRDDEPVSSDGKNTIWTQVDTVKVNWQTFHTQGLVKIGETFYVSAVEVLESTVRNGTVTDALYDFSSDRSTGAGGGWLFKFDAAGHLLGQIELTAFGGLDLVDLRRARPEHQIPVNLFIDEGTGPNPGLALTHNAFWVERSATAPCARIS